MNDDFRHVISMVQSFIQSQMVGLTLTRELIAERADTVLALNPAWAETIDRAALLRELESRFSVWIGREATLADNTDHMPWLQTKRDSIHWRFWSRYRQFLEQYWAPRSIELLDHLTDHVLGLLEDPDRSGEWDRRGLLVGHVQSGKTANYIGLISKAADAGYKLIIVLAGLHNNLRSQTQMRLDEGFLGYESMPPAEEQRRGRRYLGVGRVDPSPLADTITNRSERGDFRRAVANNFGVHLGAHPLLFIVKKNRRVLDNLFRWIEWIADSTDSSTGRRIVTRESLLVIDDEADQASIDTRHQELDDSGELDPNHDPTVINGCIRRILHAFDKSAYVGYTATPFANVFIHERGRTTDEGEDLFPRSFIVNLPAPSDYAGPVRVFGLAADGGDDEQGLPPLPVIRHVDDHAASLSLNERLGWIPPLHRNGHRPLYDGQNRIPPSLREALHAFILAIAARHARGQVQEHNSMLVHVTRFNSVQHAVFEQIEAEVSSISRRLRLGDGASSHQLRDELRQLWEADFVPTTEEMLHQGYSELHAMPWTAIEAHLETVAVSIQLREINGSAGDVLDYATHRDAGFSVIAVGGEKLSRGLTLEGLTVSYFLRTRTMMYDTLMQMGRWFGYRPGYVDLCRLYTTAELNEWFEHITEASEELRQEFDHMAAVGSTPREYGLKVRSHPVLTITSPLKLRTGTELQLSFAESVSETIVFHRDPTVVEANFQAADLLVRRLGTPAETDPVRNRPGGQQHTWRRASLWSGIPVAVIKDLLREIQTHPDAHRVNRHLLLNYIEQQEQVGELIDWTVALFCGGQGPLCDIGGFSANCTVRAPHPNVPVDQQIATQRHLIRRLLSPRDEAIDLELAAYEAALQQTIREWQQDPGRSRRQQVPDVPSGPAIRRHREPRTGLLLLYPLSPGREEVIANRPLIGIGLSFPRSGNARTVAYRVTNIYEEQELGEDV